LTTSAEPGERLLFELFRAITVLLPFNTCSAERSINLFLKHEANISKFFGLWKLEKLSKSYAP